MPIPPPFIPIPPPFIPIPPPFIPMPPPFMPIAFHSHGSTETSLWTPTSSLSSWLSRPCCVLGDVHTPSVAKAGVNVVKGHFLLSGGWLGFHVLVKRPDTKVGDMFLPALLRCLQGISSAPYQAPALGIWVPVFEPSCPCELGCYAGERDCAIRVNLDLGTVTILLPTDHDVVSHFESLVEVNQAIKAWSP